MHLENLRERLCEFGLDPAEWDLNITRRFGNFLRFEIRPLKGESLHFEGWAVHGKWLALSLLEPN